LNPLTWAKSYIRGVILRKKFPTSVIYAGASVDQTSVLGEYSVLFRNVAMIDSSLGAHSFVQSGSVVYNVELGKFCSIASNVSIGLGVHPVHMVSTSPVFYDNTQPLPKFLVNSRIFAETLPRTIIGADVWIGQGAMIKAGVTIGVGAVIGAGSIVTKDIAPYVIAAGNPCREIRPRFEEDITSRLISSEWWKKSGKELEYLANLFVEPLKLIAELDRSK
jgi:acetyltransferase-like isoleucine patch superfamily enzyme